MSYKVKIEMSNYLHNWLNTQIEDSYGRRNIEELVISALLLFKLETSLQKHRGYDSVHESDLYKDL